MYQIYNGTVLCKGKKPRTHQPAKEGNEENEDKSTKMYNKIYKQLILLII